VNETALEVIARVLVKVLRSPLAVGLMAGEHVIDGDEHRMADRDDRRPLPRRAAIRRN
jgi:hypothetical protein